MFFRLFFFTVGNIRIWSNGGESYNLQSLNILHEERTCISIFIVLLVHLTNVLSYLHFHNNSVHNKTFVSVSEASEVTPPCTPAVTRNPLGGGGSGGGDRLTVDEPKQNSRRISKDKENRKESRTHLYM